MTDDALGTCVVKSSTDRVFNMQCKRWLFVYWTQVCITCVFLISSNCWKWIFSVVSPRKCYVKVWGAGYAEYQHGRHPNPLRNTWCDWVLKQNSIFLPRSLPPTVIITIQCSCNRTVLGVAGNWIIFLSANSIARGYHLFRGFCLYPGCLDLNVLDIHSGRDFFLTNQHVE